MLTETIEWKKTRITVREMINQDLFDTVAVLSKLDPESIEHKYRRNQFSMAVLQTTQTENLPFEWVTLAASPAKMQACYKAWCEMKPALGKLWADKIFALNDTSDDEELAPVLNAGEA